MKSKTEQKSLVVSTLGQIAQSGDRQQGKLNLKDLNPIQANFSFESKNLRSVPNIIYNDYLN